MKKILPFLLLVLFVGLAFGATRINRTKNIMALGSTSDPATGRTIVVSDSTTNEFNITVSSAVVTGAATAYTNTYTTAYNATPTFVWGVKSGTNESYHSSLNVTVTSSNLIIPGLATGGVNTVPYILYGTTRNGE